MKVHTKSPLAIAALAIVIVVVIALASSAPARAAGPWYVKPGGSDGNDCLSPATACATINGALNKSGFVAGDTIWVAIGTYTGTATQVVLLDRNVTLSGGWNISFTLQSGRSTIDGQGARQGMTVNSGVTAIVDRFAIHNGSASQGGGVYNDGTLTLDNSTVAGNTATYYGGGIYNYNGIITLNNMAVSNNAAGSGGSGIFNYYGTATLNKSFVRENTTGGEGGGVNVGNGSVTLNNSTVSGNTATNGGGIWSYGTLTLNNSTISGNTGRGIFHTNGGALNINNSTISDNVVNGIGGGLFFGYGTATLRNSIIAGNSAETGSPDCTGDNTITSAGYNLIGNTSGCTFSSGIGDLPNVDPNLGKLIGFPGYYPLLLGSPAIDAGNPATPGSGGNACTITDQRGVARVGRCDIGAYEYTVPGPAARLSIVDGTPQTAPPFSAFKMPFRAAVLDSIGSPVSNTLVTFSAPASGASGTFAGTGTSTTTAISNQSGVVTAATFTANGLVGSYTVTATASGVVTPVHFSLTNFAWYVAPGGNNANDCLTPATKCATIDGVLAKPGFTPGDTIFVGAGMYTGTGAEVLLLNRSVTLSGGWNAGFTAQTGTTTINGEGARVGITVGYGVTAVVNRFLIQNGFGAGVSNSGGGTANLTLSNSTVSNTTGNGIQNAGSSLTLNGSVVSSSIGDGIHHSNGTAILNNSTARDNSGAGIYNQGATLTLNNSVVSGNTAGGINNAAGGTLTVVYSTISGNTGGGIRNSFGTLTMRNSTVNSNATVLYGWGGGIYNDFGTVTIDNSTISGNTATNGGGIANENGTVTLNSSTITGNTSFGGGGIRNHGTLTMRNTILAGNAEECFGTLNSAGYNLFGSVPSCSFTPAAGDQIDADAHLGPLEGSPGYHPLLPGSPAIHAGNPAGCLGSTGVLSTDLRGFPRFGRCDIGAYEMQPIGFSAKAADRPTVLAGNPLTYAITLTNDGATSITAIRMTDTLPISLTYTGNSLTATGGSYGYANGVITWTGSLSAGGMVTITFRATVSPTTPLNASIVNSAIINGGGEIIVRAVGISVGAKVYLPLILRSR